MDIANRRLVTDIYGEWPDFHDAEIHAVALRRNPRKDACPELYILIHLFEMTDEVDARGYFRLAKHNLVRIVFENIAELDLTGFNRQNVIESLNILETGKLGSLHYHIDIPTSYGVSMTFSCESITVCDVRPLQI